MVIMVGEQEKGPLIVKEYILIVYTDYNYDVVRYFNRKDLQNAKKKEGVMMVFQVNAETELEVEKIGEEYKEKFTAAKLKANAKKAKAKSNNEDNTGTDTKDITL